MTKWNTIRKIVTYPLILGSLALAGCDGLSQSYIKTGSYEGCRAKAVLEGKNRKVGISCGEKFDSPQLIAEDFDNDGRFERIQLYNVPKGHFLEGLIDLKTLESIFEEIKTNGKDGETMQGVKK